MTIGRVRSGLLAFLILSQGGGLMARAQDTKAPGKQPPAAKAPTAPATPEFEKQLAEWKRLLGQLNQLAVRHRVAKEADRTAIEAEYNKLLEQGEVILPNVVQAAIASYKANPNQNEEVTKFLIARANSDIANDRYQEALNISKLLLDNNAPTPRANEFAGIASFVLSDYDAAEKYLNAAKEGAEKEKKPLDEQAQMYLDEIPKYRDYWKKEQELRAAEAKTNDLPRVELKTTKGNIVLELFENEAPNTVANFVNLVEKGFYNNLPFHRVIHGFMAQGGDPKGDGTGGPGYTIKDECYEPNHRMHFAGTLSMANTGQRDTGGSQFFITYRPTPHLNGKHTVFGRVIDGMDVLEKLKAFQPGRKGEPDKILEAKVLRKREHEYKPTTLAEK